MTHLENMIKYISILLLTALSFSVSAADYRTLAVALRYLDAGSTSVASLTSATNTVSNFWQANSGGKHTFTMTVHPIVLTIPKNKPTATYCDYAFMSDAYNAIVAAGISIAQYQRAVVVVPMQSSCPYKGFQSYLGGIPASYTSSINTQYIAHELGHSIGLGHANSITCKSPAGLLEPLNLTKCWVANYGAAYDVMGKNLMLSNPVHRMKIGVELPVIHALGAGEVTHQLAQVKAVRVALANNRFLWIEYRQQIGYDLRMPWANTQGALIWVTGGFDGASCSDYAPCLVDMDQASGASALQTGRTYTNAALGVTISVVGMSPEGLTVTVRN